MDIFANTKDL